MEAAIYLSLGTMVVLISVLILALRYVMIITSVKEKMSVRNAFSILCISQLASFLSPFKLSNFVARPVITKAVSQIKIKKAFMVSAFEQVFDIAWQLILVIALLVLLGERSIVNNMQLEIVLVAVLLIFSVFFVKKYKTFIRIMWRIKPYMPKRLKKYGKKMGLGKKEVEKTLKQSLQNMLNWKLIFQVSVPTASIIILMPVVIQLCGLSFATPLSYIAAFFIYWIPQIIGKFSGIPAGFVAKDLSMVGILVFLGHDVVVAGQILLFYRLATMLPYIILGSILSVYYTKIGLRKK